MHEKFSLGIIAGATAGLVKNIPGFLFHNLLKVTDKSFWDYANIIVMGSHPNGLFEQTYAFFLELIFSIMVALGYLFIAPDLKTKYNLLRGAFYGCFVWFMVRVWVTSFHIEHLVNTTAYTIMVNSISSILFGIILEWMIQTLSKKQAS